MNNSPVFVVSNPRDFYELTRTQDNDPPTGKPDPAKMGAFQAKHPEFVKAVQLIRSQPSSSGFADSSYYGLNAFRFVNAKGESTPIRWYVAPDQKAETTNSAGTDKNYLFDALIQQIHAKTLRWHLMLTVGQPGDPTADATLQWPSERPLIDAGTLTIDSIESDDTSPTRNVNFDPLVLPDGIAPSDDPLLSARSAAYSVSFRRREGEHKDANAVSTAEVEK